MKLALMVIDMQIAYYRERSRASMDAAAEYINAAVDLFREKGLPVIWVQDRGDVVPGDPGFELLESLEPREGEYRIVKNYGNSFNGTDCEKILRDEKADCVVVTGYCAENCVLSTYRGALDLDLLPMVLRGALASGSAENLRFVENISETVTFRVLAKMADC